MVPPRISGGKVLGEMAMDLQALDLNPSHSHLLWCQDSSTTSVLANIDDEPAGVVTAHLRPEAPDTQLVCEEPLSFSF